MSSHSNKSIQSVSTSLWKYQRSGEEMRRRWTESQRWPTFGHFNQQSVCLGKRPSSRPSPKISYLKSCQQKCGQSWWQTLHTTLKRAHAHCWHYIHSDSRVTRQQGVSIAHTSKHDTQKAARSHTGKEAWGFLHHTCTHERDTHTDNLC